MNIIGETYLKAVGITLGLVLGVGGAVMIGQTAADQKADSVASDRCWVAGGDYRDGKCEMPVDTRTDEMKVCEAMNGGYVIFRDKVTGAEIFKCYDNGGTEKVMPNLEGKDVVVMSDGTVVLRDKR